MKWSRSALPHRRRAGDVALPVLVLLVVLAVGLAVFLARERALAGSRGFPLDDSWIHLHFARNLAEGAGFSYNPGVPVAGSTAPLWTLMLAGMFALAGASVGAAKALGIALAALAALMTWRLAALWTGSYALGLLAGVCLAGSGPLLWGALSGMEVVLAAVLVTGALLAHLREASRTAGALLGLAALARPEAVLLLPLVWLAGPLTIRRTAALIVPAALLLMPWAAFNAWTTGSLLPATATAKVEGGLVALMAGTREPLRRALVTRPLAFAWEWVTWLWQVNVLLPLLIVPGLAVAGMRGGRRLLLPASVLLLHPLAMALLAAYRGPSFQEGRYSIHLLPLAFTVAVTALARAGPARPRSSREAAGRGSVDAGRMRRLARGSVAVGLLVAAGLALPPAASRYGWAVQNIEVMQVHLGRWVRENTPREARLALNDVGAIAYVSRREVVDMMGLVTPGIVPYRRQGEAAVLRYLEGRCPDYLIVFPEWFPELVAREDHFAPVHRVRLPRNTVAGADEMVVYETVWNRWRPSPRPCDDSPSRGTAAAAGPESSVAPRS